MNINEQNQSDESNNWKSMGGCEVNQYNESIGRKPVTINENNPCKSNASEWPIETFTIHYVSVETHPTIGYNASIVVGIHEFKT